MCNPADIGTIHRQQTRRAEDYTMNGKQMRSTVRLKARNNSGSVVLRRLNSPLIMCDLQDISEMGCRCVARVRINDWSDAEKWRTLLETGELYEAEITYDPYIPFIRLPIEIRSSIALPANGYELGLAFFDLEPDHRQMLNKAMISIATEKIRESKGVLKRDMPAPEPPVIEPIPPMISPAAREQSVPLNTQPEKNMESSELEFPAMIPLPDHIKKSDPRLGEVLNKTGQLTDPE